MIATTSRNDLNFVSTRSVAARARQGFTLVEMLVVVAIIAIMATIVMGAIHAARQTAREARTKALIMKINSVIMEKYESYLTRRIPVDTSDLSPLQAAQTRLAAIRYLMMMEMPERFNDVNKDAASAQVDIGFGKKMAWSSLAILYGQKFAAQQPVQKNGNAKCLYMVVTMGTPEARELFSDSEIADLDGDGYPVFLDAWGHPIMFLRWAPAFTPLNSTPMPSDIQTGDPVNDHDPFDPRRTDTKAFKLTPLIYSAGADGRYCIEQNANFQFQGDAYTNGAGGPAMDTEPTSGKQYINCYHDNIHNHHIESR
jgi:prepilin-type N-terminal cleavage/methylation domain-containing protein